MAFEFHPVEPLCKRRMGWYKEFHLRKSFMALVSHVCAKGLHVVLREWDGVQEKGDVYLGRIASHTIFCRGEFYRHKNQVEENAIVMKKDCNQSSITEIQQNSQSCEILHQGSNRTWRKTKHWRDKYISTDLSLYEYKKCSLSGKRKK